MKAVLVDKRGLDALFTLESVSVIGATDRAGSVGRTVLANLLNPNFHGRVYPINSRRSEVMGVKAYNSIRSSGTCASGSIGDPAVAIPALIGEPGTGCVISVINSGLLGDFCVFT